MSTRVRFAPSPTGFLHVGNIRAALINWMLARKQSGSFILRLDDTDPERSKQEFADAIKTDLAWLGLTPDEEYKQSDRIEKYDAAAAKLKEMGRLYPCYETPEEIKFKASMQLKRGKPPVYDRAALKLTDEDRAKLEADGLTPHWRFKLNVPGRVEFQDLIRGKVSIDLASVSDPVLIRGDGSYLYTLPSVVDDLDLQISHVVRGEDHVTNSGVQTEIFEALGGKAPEYAHFSLFTAADGSGLSKRDSSLAIHHLRDDAGIEAMAVISYLAHIGTSDSVQAVWDVRDLVAAFDFSKFSRTPVRFDPEELLHLNAKLMHLMEFDDVKNKVTIEGFDADFWHAVRPNIEKLSDVADWWSVVHGSVDVDPDADPDYLTTAADLLPDGALDDGSWKKWTDAIKAATGRKGRDLFLPLRKALTGMDHGPEMHVMLALIGRERALERLKG